MIDLPPKYTETELQSILKTDPQLPNSINESDFVSDIQSNTRIKWRVNHFLFKKNLLSLLLDTSTLRKWKILKSLNWLIVLSIIAFTIGIKDYKILLFLIIFPLLIITVDHWIFIFNMSVIVGVKLLFKLYIPYFWFFVIAVTLGYLLNKIIDEMIEKKILKQALTDRATFWKYYLNRLIWIDESVRNNEYQILTTKYPELRSL